MSKFLLLFLACLILVSPVFAGPMQCPAGAYTLYLVANFSCTINGNLTYTNFAGGNGTGNPTGVAIPASSVTGTPITTPGNEGFQFSSGWNVTTNLEGTSRFQDNLPTFRVIDSTTALHLTFNSAFQGTGVAGV